MANLQRYKSETGFRRILADFIGISVVVIPSLYLTLILAAVTKIPILYSRGEWGQIIGNRHFYTIFLVILIVTLFLIKKDIGSYLGGLQVVNNDTESAPTKKQGLKRTLTQIITTLVLYYVVMFPVFTIVGFAIMLIFFGLNQLGVMMGVSFLHFNIHNSLGSTSPLDVILELSVPIIFLVLYYFAFIRTWKKRGIPDIVSGTKVISSDKGIGIGKLAFLAGMLLTAYICLKPTALYLENSIKYTLPHPDTIIETSNLKEYKNQSGWSIRYNDIRFQPDVQKERVVFRTTSNPVSTCIYSFTIEKTQSNPESKTLEQFYSDLEQKNHIKYFENSQRENAQFIGVSGWKITKQGDPTFNISKSIEYLIPINNVIYSLSYDIPSKNLYKDAPPYPAEECNQNEQAVQKIFSTFNFNRSS